MSVAEIIFAVRALSRDEKYRVAQSLLEDLANEEPETLFKDGQVFPIYTPQFAPNAAAQLAEVPLLYSGIFGNPESGGDFGYRVDSDAWTSPEQRRGTRISAVADQ